MSPMKTTIALALGLLLLGTPAQAQDALRWVVEGPYSTALWFSVEAFRLCGQLQKSDCSKLGPKVEPLTRVERLDPSRACGPMVSVRVLDGPLKGETGCLSAESLTSIKPEGAR